MKEQLKLSLVSVLGYANAFPTKMTDPFKLRSLMSSLYPLTPYKELIRLGPKGDGGYLLPDDLEAIHACFSPGVSIVSGFEKDCAERGMKVFLADKSVSGPAEEHELFHFTKKFIGAVSNEEFMTLDEWVYASLPECESDLLLQIDIEGCEYEVFLSTSNSLMSRFRIIVAEFHCLDLLWSDPFFSLAGRAFDRILQTHSCVHIHPNNYHGSITKAGLTIPKTMEFTFLRKDRIARRSYQSTFPNPLDYNNTDDSTLPLPDCWYRGEGP